MKKFLLTSSTIFFLGFGVAVAYTSPGKPTGYVNDYTSTLSQDTRVSLENLLTEFKNSGAGEISIVIIPALNGDSLEEYSITLAREWGIGQKGKDNGALLLVVKESHDIRIEVGYGFEGDLTDAKSHRIIDEVISPRFKEGNFNAGVTNGVKEMIGVVAPGFVGGTHSVDYSKPNPASNSNSSGTFWLYGLGLLFMFLSSALAQSKSWWAGGIVGGIIGGVISFFVGFWFLGLIAVVALVVIGLIFDYIVSKGVSGNSGSFFRIGGGSSGSSGGSFGGFGGGSFGGGGSSGKW